MRSLGDILYNFHWVLPGEAARMAQPWAGGYRAFLAKRGIKAIVAAGHINLVETLAERIAALGLADHRVEAARVRVEKLHVVAEAESVGVEIERFRPRG